MTAVLSVQIQTRTACLTSSPDLPAWPQLRRRNLATLLFPGVGSGTGVPSWVTDLIFPSIQTKSRKHQSPDEHLQVSLCARTPRRTQGSLLPTLTCSRAKLKLFCDGRLIGLSMYLIYVGLPYCQAKFNCKRPMFFPRVLSVPLLPKPPRSTWDACPPQLGACYCSCANSYACGYRVIPHQPGMFTHPRRTPGHKKAPACSRLGPVHVSLERSDHAEANSRAAGRP